LGIAFHIGIIVLLGLMSFGLVMIAALILYLRPLEQPFHLATWQAPWKRLMELVRTRRMQRHATSELATPATESVTR
jgi:hypothetical protein